MGVWQEHSPQRLLVIFQGVIVNKSGLRLPPLQEYLLEIRLLCFLDLVANFEINSGQLKWYRKTPKFGHIFKFDHFFLAEIIFFRTCFYRYCFKKSHGP
jgi:hypothetical protein